MPGRRLEADDRLRLRAGAHARDVLAHMRDAARIARGADFLEQSHGRELGIGREPGGDNAHEWIELGRPRRILPGRCRLDIAAQLAGGDPVMHHAPAHAKALGDGGLRQTLIEQMLK
jgi:hypothetical protein